MIKGEEKDQGHWKIGITNNLYTGKNNIIRVAQLRIGKKLIKDIATEEDDGDI